MKKSMRSILAALLVIVSVVMAGTLMEKAALAQAALVQASGETELHEEIIGDLENLAFVYRYTVDERGNATIVSVKAMGTALTYVASLDSDIALPETLGRYPVTGIGNQAFRGCAYELRDLAIPDTITEIANGAFEGCHWRTKIWVSPTHPTLSKKDNALFDKEQKRLIRAENDIGEAYVIPDGTTTLDDCAFSIAQPMILLSLTV